MRYIVITNKLCFFLMVFVFLSITNCFAQEKYVRKQIKPSFYVPEKAIATKEKLPPIYVPKPPVVQAKKKTIEVEEYYDDEEEYDDEEVSTAQNKTEGGELSIESVTADNKYIDFVTAGYTEKPIYGQKFEEYSNDLLYISETGKYPKNENLSNDLSQMDSNNPFVYK